MQRRGTNGSKNETKEKKSSKDLQKSTAEASSSSRPNLRRNPQPTVDSFMTTKGRRVGKSRGPSVSTDPITAHIYTNPMFELQNFPIGSTTIPPSSSTNTERVTRSRTKMMTDRETVLPSVSGCESPSSASLSSQTSSTSSSFNKDTLATSRKCRSSARLAAQVGDRLAKSQISPTSTSSTSNTKSTKSKSSSAKVSASSDDKSTGMSKVLQGPPKSTKSSRIPKIPTDSSSALESSVPLLHSSSQSTEMPTTKELGLRKAFTSSDLNVADECEYKKADKHEYLTLLADWPDSPEGQTPEEEVSSEDKGTPVFFQGTDRYEGGEQETDDRVDLPHLSTSVVEESFFS